MPLPQSTRRFVSLGLLLALTGCATINANVDPWAREAGVRAGAPVLLYGAVGDVKVYEEGSETPLKVVIVQNPSFKQAMSNAVRQEFAQVQANHNAGGHATYTQKMRFTPAVYLNQKHKHNLRVVHADGRSNVIEATPHIGRSFLIVDWLLTAPTFFASMVIDATTGKWKVFDPINVDVLFRPQGSQDAAAASASRVP
jgi:hypothetical protein